MNIPNALSLFRIALVPVFMLFYFRGMTEAAMAALLLGGLSDILDGMIARKFNMVTELGKILDPVADKLIQTAMMVCAIRSCPAVWWLLGIHVFRELCLSAMGLYVIKTTGRVEGAKWYGKLCTAAIYLCMIMLLAFPKLPQSISSGAVCICAAMAGACLLLYAGNYMSILRESRRQL